MFHPWLFTLQGHNLLRTKWTELKRVSKCFYLLVEQNGMQAVLLGSTRNFSTMFINGGFVREQSTVYCDFGYHSKNLQLTDDPTTEWVKQLYQDEFVKNSTDLYRYTTLR